jgi:hypothetical protein
MKPESIQHPLIEKWAMAWWELDHSVRKAVDAMSPEDLAKLKAATLSLTNTNCWYAAYDFRPVIEGHIAVREVRERSKKSSTAPSRGAAEDKG